MKPKSGVCSLEDGLTLPESEYPGQTQASFPQHSWHLIKFCVTCKLDEEVSVMLGGQLWPSVLSISALGSGSKPLSCWVVDCSAVKSSLLKLI